MQACTLNSARLVRCGLSRRDGVCRSRSIGQSLRPPPRADLSGQGSGAKGRKATTALCFMERNGLRHHSLVAVPVLMPEASLPSRAKAGLGRTKAGQACPWTWPLSADHTVPSVSPQGCECANSTIGCLHTLGTKVWPLGFARLTIIRGRMRDFPRHTQALGSRAAMRGP